MKDSFSEINVVPLVDIILVLLVIVLITASFMAHGVVEVKLPKSDSQGVVAQEAIRLEITSEGKIFYNRKELDREGIPLLLSGLNHAQPILISADKDLRLQPFITVLDDIKRLGFTHISVHTEK